MAHLKIGNPNLQCPHCFKEQYSEPHTPVHVERAASIGEIKKLNRKLKHSKDKGKIDEILVHQARIEQLNHGGWPIEVQAWANVCPDCDTVTEYRAVPSHFYRFSYHGPVAESVRCTDCREKLGNPEG
jgi:hypothetical protein